MEGETASHHQPNKIQRVGSGGFVANRTGENTGQGSGVTAEEERRQREDALMKQERRRAKNRESAAKSRKKTRETITNLENAANEAKNKYEAALRYILNIENERLAGKAAAAGMKSSSSNKNKTNAANNNELSLCPPAVLCRDLAELRKTSPQLMVRNPVHYNNPGPTGGSRSSASRNGGQAPTAVASAVAVPPKIGSNGSNAISGSRGRAAAPVVSGAGAGANSKTSSSSSYSAGNSFDPKMQMIPTVVGSSASATTPNQFRPLPLDADSVRTDDRAMVNFWARNDAFFNNNSAAAQSSSIAAAATGAVANPLACQSSSAVTAAALAPAALGDEFDDF